jgi:uncharacterized membrane protein
MGVDGSLYKFLLVLHIACVVLGFGALAFNGFNVGRASKHTGADRAGIVEASDEVSRIAEFFVYAAFVFGLLLVATSKSLYKFSQGWLSGAMALYIVDLGVLHGVIRRSQKQYSQLTDQVNGAARPPGAAPPPGVGELARLEQRISIGWAAFDVLFLVVIYLMVFKPGS